MTEVAEVEPTIAVPAGEAEQYAYIGNNPVPCMVSEEAARVSKHTAGTPSRIDVIVGDATLGRTGSVLGKPGQWTPYGCAVPRNAAQAVAWTASITPKPATAWTTGQFLRCADGSLCYWNGSAWTAGKAP
jgi:hypothetical protein